MTVTDPSAFGRRPADSDAPVWPSSPTPPADAPNVVVIMTDDVGFGASSTFGGLIPTPTLDRLAAQGLRYNRFHTTAMCSPTRAALMTGRNHHRVGAGRVTELAMAYDGYTCVLPDNAGTVAEMLRTNGYATAHFGKYHNVPLWETGPSGPFDRWPTHRGYEHFYGFLGGSTDNWAPSLYRDTTPIEPPTDDPTYHLERDLADQAISWLRTQHSTAPDRPVFVQYSTGAAHAPHHAPDDWIAKFAGQFDHGWDAAREQILQRQVAAGVVPAGTELTARPDEIAAWDSLSSDQRRAAARMMEVYAANLAFADAQIGRVLDELAALGRLDNTLVFYIQGDNGASPEGGDFGLLNEVSYPNGMAESLDQILVHLDELGGPLHYNSYPVGWAHATDTPFQWFKMVASHFGGTRNGLVVSYPKRITDHGGVRSQFHHVIDIVPTILEVTGIEAPEVLHGVPQLSLDGVSMAYTFDDPAAASQRTTQYFELMGNLAIYHDGWVAATTPVEMPWQASRPDRFPENWELYHVAEDFSQYRDVAAEHPDRVAELVDLFWAEAEANRVLPVIAGRAARVGPPQPNPVTTRSTFRYLPGTARIPMGSAPDITNRSFTITSAFEVADSSAEGMVLAHGNRFGGHCLYLADGVVTYHYNLVNQEHTTVRATTPVGPGRHQVEVRFVLDSDDVGSGADVTLLVDEVVVAQVHLARTAARRVNYTGALTVGRASGSPVSEAYRAPFVFTGDLEHVTLSFP